MRQRPTHETSFQDRLSQFMADAREKDSDLPDDSERAALLKKIRHAETATNIDGWTSSSGLQPRK
jgi:hypothetical protein